MRKSIELLRKIAIAYGVVECRRVCAAVKGAWVAPGRVVDIA
jgi:hypothetical protein